MIKLSSAVSLKSIGLQLAILAPARPRPARLSLSIMCQSKVDLKQTLSGVEGGVTRILGLDVGERRIGVAISTPEGSLAVPLRVLERSEESADLRAIAELAVAENATAIVVGHPISLDGSRGAQARSVEAFAHSLAETSGLAVELADERLTSAEAKRGRSQSSRSQRARRAPVDDLAAAIILQAYLDRRRPTAAPDPTAPADAPDR